MFDSTMLKTILGPMQLAFAKGLFKLLDEDVNFSLGPFRLSDRPHVRKQ